MEIKNIKIEMQYTISSLGIYIFPFMSVTSANLSAQLYMLLHSVYLCFHCSINWKKWKMSRRWGV